MFVLFPPSLPPSIHPSLLGFPLSLPPSIPPSWGSLLLQGIAFDQTREHLFIADSGNDRLLCITLGARLVPEFGQNGEFRLASPSCVAVDTDGFILVTSTTKGLLTVLTPQGLQVNQLGADGKMFGRPCGVCVNESGTIAIADSARPPSIHIL